MLHSKTASEDCMDTIADQKLKENYCTDLYAHCKI